MSKIACSMFGLLAVFAVGCVAPVSGEGTAREPAESASGTATSAAPETYKAIEDAQAANAIGTTMWTTLTSAPCWYEKGSTNNYSFYGELQWRYAGTMDTYSGNGQVHSTGKYGAMTAAVVKLYSGDYLMVIIDDNTFTLFRYVNDQPALTVYTANRGPGACV
jgi:hypothetical protein